MFILTMFAVAVITVLFALFTFEIVRWEEQITDSDESVLSQVLRERRQRRDEEQFAS